MRRAAKGLCFISEYKAVSEIMQPIDNVCLIGMRDLLTRLGARAVACSPTFDFCQQFTGVEPLHLLFPVFRKKFLHA